MLCSGFKMKAILGQKNTFFSCEKVDYCFEPVFREKNTISAPCTKWWCDCSEPKTTIKRGRGILGHESPEWWLWHFFWKKVQFLAILKQYGYKKVCLRGPPVSWGKTWVPSVVCNKNLNYFFPVKALYGVSKAVESIGMRK